MSRKSSAWAQKNWKNKVGDARVLIDYKIIQICWLFDKKTPTFIKTDLGLGLCTWVMYWRRTTKQASKLPTNCSAFKFMTPSVDQNCLSGLCVCFLKRMTLSTANQSKVNENLSRSSDREAQRSDCRPQWLWPKVSERRTTGRDWTDYSPTFSIISFYKTVNFSKPKN